MNDMIQRSATGAETPAPPPARPRLGLRYGQTQPSPQSGATR